MKTFRSILIIGIACWLTACEEQNKRNGGASGQDGEVYTTEDYARDMMAEEEGINQESAAICLDLTMAAEKLADVKSPDMLIQAKKDYAEAMASAKQGLGCISGDEKQAVLKHQKEAEEAYRQACRQYELPPNGVISNLKNLISRIDQIRNRQELERFESVRLGMLRNLDDIHLCVEQNSSSIPEVKRLAQTLKGKYAHKRHEFGLE